MIIVLLGPPGSGKGTQAELISRELGFFKIAIGDIFREMIENGDEMGKAISDYLKNGLLVPDEFVLKMVKKKIEESVNTDYIIFDGFPRNVNQVDLFNKFLNSLGKKVNMVIYFDTPFSIISQRLSNRRVCPECGAVYNMVTSPPRNDNKCDKCGATLIQRNDDREDVIKKRFEVYERETVPLIDYYKEKGLLVKIDAGAPEEIVWNNVLKAIEDWRGYKKGRQ